ncbi:MAG: hypothetical protein ACXWQ5_08800 [Ktedonobacterales bacterium]
MALNSFDGSSDAQSGDSTGDEAAYHDGYARVIRELTWARSRGFVPTERQLVLALTEANRVYSTVRGGKFVGGRRPEWLRGRADALRSLLRDGISTIPSDDD